MLHKGSRVYVEGRIQSRKWTGQDGVERTTVEIVVSDMLVLESKRDQVAGEDSGGVNVPEDFGEAPAPEPAHEKVEKKTKKGKNDEAQKQDESEDIPF